MMHILEESSHQVHFSPHTPAALITGASQGIGYELAQQFAKNGHPLILTAKQLSPLATASKTLHQKYHVPIKYIACDLAIPQAATNLLTQIQNESIAFLINNAGLGHFGEFTAVSLRQQQDLLQVNILALTELTHLCLPLLLQQKKAHILNVASTAAFQPGPYLATYYASKAYVLSFSEALAYELQQNTHVNVTCLCPGPTETQFHHRAQLTHSPLFKKNMMTAEQVAKIGYQAMLKRKRLIIPGWKNKCLIAISTIAPRRLTTRIAGYLNRHRQS